jgi:hypothetical protein
MPWTWSLMLARPFNRVVNIWLTLKRNSGVSRNLVYFYDSRLWTLVTVYGIRDLQHHSGPSPTTELRWYWAYQPIRAHFDVHKISWLKYKLPLRLVHSLLKMMGKRIDMLILWSALVHLKLTWRRTFLSCDFLFVSLCALLLFIKHEGRENKRGPF